MATGIISMLAETAVHAGTGSDIGAVDLPHQRERATGIPTIHGSGIKGALRDAAGRCLSNSIVVSLFGSAPPQAPGGAQLEPGALAFSDARLLLFPCRTVGPIFAWVTSPYLLARFQRDAHSAGFQCSDVEFFKPSDSEAYVTTTSHFGGQVFIEEFSFTKKADSRVDKWAEFIRDNVLPGDGKEKSDNRCGGEFIRDNVLPGDELRSYDFWRNHVVKSLVVVSDSNLRDFVTYGTEVVTRVRLDPRKKTVVEGALWTEEYLPQDTVMYCVVVEALRAGQQASPLGQLSTVINRMPVIQFGGKESIGRGFMRLRLL